MTGDFAFRDKGAIAHPAIRVGRVVYKGDSGHISAHDKIEKDYGGTIPDKLYDNIEDGFLTTKGHFVGREEAAKIAARKKQLRPDARLELGYLAHGLDINYKR